MTTAYLADLLVLPLLEYMEPGHRLDGGAGHVEEGRPFVIRVTRSDAVYRLPGLGLRAHILVAHAAVGAGVPGVQIYHPESKQLPAYFKSNSLGLP